MQPDRDGRLTVVLMNDFASVTGGIDRVVLAEAEGLASRGHDVTLLAGQGPPASELVEAGVRVLSTGQHTTREHPSSVKAAAQGLWNRSAAQLAREVLRECDPERTVVHLHGFTKVLSASVVRAAVRSGAATVATLHEYFAVCPNGGYFNYQTGQVCHLTPLSARCVVTHCDARAYSHKLWRVARSQVQRSVGSMPAGVLDLIVPSHSAGEIVRPFLPPQPRLRVVPNPVPAARVDPVDPAQSSLFVFIGRLSHEKGPLILARAARRAALPAVFVGAGDEAEAVRREYPDAEVTGWLDPGEVQARLRTARAVVNASICYETQGLTTLEAAAHGVPAVVPDLGVLTEIVTDQQTGLWFRRGDPVDLAAKLRRVADDDHLVKTLGATAYQRFWSASWDLDTHLDRVEDVYRDALHRRRVGRHAA
jgi:glycosyltransferase involved in cell wall biosynthesis